MRGPEGLVSYRPYLARILSWDYGLGSIGYQDTVSSDHYHRKRMCLDLMGTYANDDSRSCELRLPKVRPGAQKQREG